MIRVCVVAPAHMTGGQRIAARTVITGFADDPDFRLELQPIDPPLPPWLAGIRGLRTIARMPLYLGGLVRRIGRADVVHIYTAAFWPFVLTTLPALVLARLMGRPVLLNYHDGRAAEHLAWRWVRWTLRRATVLVFPSEFLRAIFHRFALDGEVVFNVPDIEQFRFRCRERLSPTLISCRLLERLYAVENTLRAFALIRAAKADARLIVIGGGDQEERLKAIVRDERIEGVEFHGPVTHREVAAWFDRADIFVNSSRADNMPNSIIEAFASGLPVVTTRPGGIPFIVEHERNGLLVEVDDPDALAAAVLRLLDDPALAGRLVQEGRRDCRERYSWEVARAHWSDLYGRLAHKRVSSAPEREVLAG